jgi:DNA mismatch repair ATPase MutS
MPQVETMCICLFKLILLRIYIIIKVFARFSESGEIWSRAIRCVATLDALSSFASISNQHGMVRPEIVDEVGVRATVCVFIYSFIFFFF